MYRRLFLLVLPILAATPAAGPTSSMLVFMDRTSSASAATCDLVEGVVAKRLPRLISGTGDGLAISAITAETGGMARSRISVWAEPSLPEAVSRIEKKRNDTIVLAHKERFVRSELAEAASLCRRPIPSSPARWTDLWATFEVVGDYWRRLDRPDRLEVHYVSDMRESMAGESRRDFDKRPPTSLAQASAWAGQDADWIRRNLLLDPEALASVAVTIHAGDAAERAGFSFIKRYWQGLFGELGMGRDRVSFL